MASRAASFAASYAAAWDASASRHAGGGFAPDPSYPTVTGTEELKVEGDTLAAVAAQVASWPNDWDTFDPARVADAACVVGESVFADEKHIAWNGQGEPLFIDRGAALGLQSGLTFFFVIETGTISGASAHANMFQCSRGDAVSRMSMVARRNDVNEFLAWWDEGAGWLETTTVLADDTKYIISFRSDNTSMKVAVNGGAEEAVGNPTHQQMEFYNIGSSTAATEPFIGNQAAVIAYRSELSDADRILVRDYLNAKYVVY